MKKDIDRGVGIVNHQSGVGAGENQPSPLMTQATRSEDGSKVPRRRRELRHRRRGQRNIFRFQVGKKNVAESVQISRDQIGRFRSKGDVPSIAT